MVRRTLATPQADIHFPQGYEAFARRAADILADAAATVELGVGVDELPPVAGLIHTHQPLVARHRSQVQHHEHAASAGVASRERVEKWLGERAAKLLTNTRRVRIAQGQALVAFYDRYEEF